MGPEDQETDPARPAPEEEHLDPKEVLGISNLVPTYEAYKIASKFGELMMANGVTCDNVDEAMDYLVKRDHPDISKLISEAYTPGMLGTKCLPPEFISKIPKAIVYEQYNQRREDATQSSKRRKLEANGEIDERDEDEGLSEHPDYQKNGQLQGDPAEREVFELVKRRLEKSKDDNLMLFSHEFMCDKDSKAEKDCIVVNLSRGYIMVIECKASKRKFMKGIRQLKDAKIRIQKVVNSVKGMSEKWKFVSLYYQKDKKFKQQNVTDFTIIGASEFESKFQKIEMECSKRRWQADRHVKEFVSICKTLMFEAQGNPDAPITGAKIVEKIDDNLNAASTPANIFFWTPEQLSIVTGIRQEFMVLMAYYGCGKTLLLKQRAMYLLDNTPETVYFFVDPNCEGLMKTLFAGFTHPRLKLKALRNIYRGPELGRRKRAYANNNQLLQTLDEFEVTGEDHVIVDELFLGNMATFISGLDEVRSKVKSLWVAIGAIDIHLITEQDLRKLPDEVNAIDGMICPTLQYSLRNGNLILNYSLSSSPYSDKLYKILGSQLAKPTNMNKGNIKKITLKSDQLGNAVKVALENIPKRQKTLFACDSHGNLAEDIKKKFCIRSEIDENYSNLKWKFSGRENELMEWIVNTEENEDCYLVVCTGFYPPHKDKSPAVTSSNEYSGIEVRSMVYFTRICPDCRTSMICPNLTTRAKASLIIIRLEVLCEYCTKSSKRR